MTSSEFVQSLWGKWECPALSAVILGNGDVYPLTCSDDIPDSSTINYPFIVEKRVSITDPGFFQLVSFAPGLNETAKPRLRIPGPGPDTLCLGGDCCTSGECGWVATVRASDNHLLWLIFLEHSNPIERLEIKDETIVASTNLNAQFAIPLFAPTMIALEGGD